MNTILVVDDSAMIREPIELALQTRGYQTVSAANGREALDMLRAKTPDLILLDIAMPVMDGIEFLDTMRKNPQWSELPVILLTATADRRNVVSAAKHGVQNYLLKTQFSMSDLVTRVETCLAGGSTKKPSATGTGPKRESGTTPPPKSPVTGAASGMDLGAEVMQPKEALRTLRPMMTKSDVLDRLEACGELHAFSPTVTRILKMTSNPNCSLEKVAKVIKQDHAIAIKILKLANSSIFDRGEPVETVETAVARIGLTQMREVVMNIGVIDELGSVSIGDRVDAGQFWEHSIACGIIAGEIALTLDDVDADAAFTMGLVHDVGRLIYNQQFVAEYQEVLRVADSLQLPLEQVESRLLVVNHADGMDRLLHAWKFPKRLIDPMVFHHLSIGNIRRMAPRRVNEVATLALADRLCHALMLGSSGNDTIYDTDDYVQALHLDATVIAKIEDTAAEEAENLKLALLSGSNYREWSNVKARYRDQLKEPFRPLFIGARPETDAFRIFCDQLGERDGEDPTMIVVHLAETRHRVRLTSELIRKEAEYGVKGLPVIVISADGQQILEQKIHNERVCGLLPAPVTIPRFINMVNTIGVQASISHAA